MKFNLNLYIDAIFAVSREDIDAVTEALGDNGIFYDIISDDDDDDVRVDARCEDLKELKKLEKLLKSI